MKSIEIIGKFEGERFRFDNPDGSSIVIGSIRLANGSKAAAEKHGAEPHGQITIKGEADKAELEPRKTYRFLGHFQDYTNRRYGTKEKQFHFRTFVPHVPHDEDGLVNYLIAAGRGNGIGPAKAKRLVKHFGCDEVLQACRCQPEEVSKVASIETHFAEAFSQKLVDQQATENATLEVDRLLTGRGFPKTLGRKCIKQWGNKAAEVITSDPYQLMQFRGVGFRLTDKLYIELGKDPVSIDRQALCLWYGIASDHDGHTWFPAAEAVSRLHKTIGAAGVDFRAAIVRGREFGQIDEEHYGALASIRSDGIDGPLTETGASLWLAEGKYAAAEEALAGYITKAITETESHHYASYTSETCQEQIILEHARCHRCHRPLTAADVHIYQGKPYGPTCISYIEAIEPVEVQSLTEWLAANPITRTWIEERQSDWFETPAFSLWPDVDTIERIDEHQRLELGRALTSRVSILGGSPGTGKSFAVSQLVRSLLATGRVGLHEIGIGAPTGKACVRLTELLQAAGIDTTARTWHSLLGVGQQSETSGWSFRHGPGNPLPYKVLIGDESSMIDLSLMRSIFSARQPGCHVLLVGDINQLPPVGNGAPLRDMIAAGIAYGELTEIKRNSGGIVEACAAMRDQQPWTHFTRGENTNLVSIPVAKSNALDQLRDDILSVSESLGGDIDPVWDCQVLVAVNERSELSRKSVNEYLQNALNPNPKTGNLRFRLKDKVVCLKNGFFESVMDIDFGSDEIETNERGEVYVANGELGSVENIVNESQLIVRLFNPVRIIRVPLGKSQKDDGSQSGAANWDLGYALSCHKSQGSEWPAVFVVLDDYPGARMVCDRAWLYTAISRARQKCYLLGDINLAERFCRQQKMATRKTFLRERIVLEAFQQEASSL